MTFEDLGLSPEVLKAIEDAGYTEPTPIQEKSIPTVLMGRDVLGGAQTGTGKTASFTLPMIDILASGRARARMPRSLILEPTRELAAQVSENFEKYGKYNQLSMALLIGGESFKDQERKLDRGVDVLIATPGRLLDLFGRGKILLADAKILVIDEADRMLDMGFMPDVEKIVSFLPKIRQTLFFSATMPPEIRRLADAFLMNPKEITVSARSAPAENVEQRVVRVSSVAKDKRASLRDLIAKENVVSALIFCNRKRDVGIVFRSLSRHDLSVAELHGDMAQPARMATLKRFKDGEVKLLVCSDVAARGLDIPLVSHVFNYDVPINAEDYIHRIGRTGRAGRSGQSFTLVSGEEAKALAAINKLIGRKIDEHGAKKVEDASASRDASSDAANETTTAKPDASEKPSRRSRGRRSSRGSGARDNNTHGDQVQREADAPASNVKELKRPAKERAKPREDKPSDEGGVHTLPFGDHTPAFILRPLKLAASA